MAACQLWKNRGLFFPRRISHTRVSQVYSGYLFGPRVLLDLSCLSIEPVLRILLVPDFLGLFLTCSVFVHASATQFRIIPLV